MRETVWTDARAMGLINWLSRHDWQKTRVVKLLNWSEHPWLVMVGGDVITRRFSTFDDAIKYAAKETTK